MKTLISWLFIILGFNVSYAQHPPKLFSLKNYQGKPWNNQVQEIPGKIQCEWYDLGGEGVAYHEKDSINNGSGKLNPADGTFLNEFRMNEGVDISYTKARDIDNSPYNLVEPTIGELYLGWTEPKEWVNYSVKVKKTSYYSIDIMYTASGDGGISLWIDGKEISQEITVPSTRNEKEPVAWRQWHHWNKITNDIPNKIKKGNHILTLKIVKNGNMNLDFIDFKSSSK